jgi:hypothetical protein
MILFFFSPAVACEFLTAHPLFRPKQPATRFLPEHAHVPRRIMGAGISNPVDEHTKQELEELVKAILGSANFLFPLLPVAVAYSHYILIIHTNLLTWHVNAQPPSQFSTPRRRHSGS